MFWRGLERTVAKHQQLLAALGNENVKRVDDQLLAAKLFTEFQQYVDTRFDVRNIAFAAIEDRLKKLEAVLLVSTESGVDRDPTPYALALEGQIELQRAEIARLERELEGEADDE